MIRRAGAPVGVNWVLRILVAVMLGIDAVVHVRLAPGYQQASPGGIGQGNLFYIEAALAVLAAVYVLIRGSGPAFVFAALVTAGGLAAILLYRYVNIPAIGPIPAMYEPVWFVEKVFVALAQAVGLVFAILGAWTRSRAPVGGRVSV